MRFTSSSSILAPESALRARTRRAGPAGVSRRELLRLAAGGALGAAFGCSGRTTGTENYELPRTDSGSSFDSGVIDSGRVTPLVDARRPVPQYRDSGTKPPFDTGAPPPPKVDAPPTPGCIVTDENILGPFYKPNAPFRDDIRDGIPGDLLIISGIVRAADCTPLQGALVDVWQADANGAYDSAGFGLRGRLETDAAGAYELVTLMPGRYLNGSQYRPAHVHYIVSHPAGVPLTTQLYFEGDPFNDVDPFIVDSLVMPLNAEASDGGNIYRVQFDVTLG